MKIYFQLIWTFIKVGALTFGGGYAMLPVLQRETIEKYNWVTYEEVMDYYAVSQAMPGLIMVNTSAFIGHKLKGKPGAILAGVSSAIPSLIIITAVASLLNGLSGLDIIQHAFAGVRVCVIVLIINSLEKLWKNAIIDRITLLIFICVFLASLFTKISPVILVICFALFGVLKLKFGGDDL